ncbi:MAG: GNAT family N-acetyltransferase [Erysipelotrichaceae bacterium]|nr:GNAT family N-acetyltransferase [Erysipelotrichaceae bacterium]
MIEIRVMTIEDYDGVYDLWVNTPGMGMNTTDDSREGIEKYLKRNPNTVFIALDEKKIIGVIMAGHDGRRGYIYHTMVHPDYRGQGIGRKLVDAVMDALDKEGINKVALVAYEDNELGNAFWEHIGFTLRTDLSYRNKNIHALTKIETGKIDEERGNEQ